MCEKGDKTRILNCIKIQNIDWDTAILVVVLCHGCYRYCQMIGCCEKKLFSCFLESNLSRGTPSVWPKMDEKKTIHPVLYYPVLTVISTLVILMPLLSTWWTKSLISRSTSNSILLALAAVHLGPSRSKMTGGTISRYPLSVIYLRNRCNSPPPKRAASASTRHSVIEAENVMVATVNANGPTASWRAIPRARNTRLLLPLWLPFASRWK